MLSEFFEFPFTQSRRKRSFSAAQNLSENGNQDHRLATFKRRLLYQHPVTTSSKDALLNTLFRKAIASGFFMQVAHLGDADSYITVKDHQQVYLHPSKTLEGKPEWYETWFDAIIVCVQGCLSGVCFDVSELYSYRDQN